MKGNLHMKNKTVRLHITDVPADLHKSIKMAAVEDEKPLKEWVKDVLRNEIARRQS